MSKCIYFSKSSNVDVKSIVYKSLLQQQNPQIAKFLCPSILNLIPVCTTSHTCGNHGGNRCRSLLYLPGIYSILYTRLSRNLQFYMYSYILSFIYAFLHIIHSITRGGKDMHVLAGTGGDRLKRCINPYQKMGYF